MKKANQNTGRDFVNHQQAVDKAKNEKLKNETGSTKLDPAQANRSERRNLKTDVSQKKTGGGKQSSPGD